MLGLLELTPQWQSEKYVFIDTTTICVWKTKSVYKT